MAPVPTEEFTRLTSPFRRELLAHCYRMLGSVHEAEDLVQETYLRAWRSYGTYAGRSSLRSWMYRIATNACLTALEQRGRRPLPSGLGGPRDDPHAPLDPARPEAAWLQPLPDALLEPEADDPAEIVTSRESVRLAFVAALQQLSPKLRAVLLLRDVLGWRAAEVAEHLGTTTHAVNSAVRRARDRLAEQPAAPEDLTEPADPEHRALLRRYMAAFESADMAALARLLSDDVTLEMPPYPTWFTGRSAVAGFLDTVCARLVHGCRLTPTRANAAPAAALWLPAPTGALHAHAIHVLAVRNGVITGITAFLDPSLFPAFGLPETRPAPDGTGVPREEMCLVR